MLVPFKFPRFTDAPAEQDKENGVKEAGKKGKRCKTEDKKKPGEIERKKIKEI